MLRKEFFAVCAFLHVGHFFPTLLLKDCLMQSSQKIWPQVVTTREVLAALGVDKQIAHLIRAGSSGSGSLKVDEPNIVTGGAMQDYYMRKLSR
ncbi:hypothetical protein BJ741DRAFT_305025 [Chytriomyces cf. hyalinus JEL632]|nr:hypothetical protein BJ741DRAFT_305025 [Chytriomyces cf. hyalinus JEL632]